MATKRPVDVEGNRPGKPKTKRPSTTPSTDRSSRKTVFSEGCILNRAVGKREWSEAENSALVQYICLFWDDAVSDKWPMHRDSEFWDACANAANKACNSSRTVNVFKIQIHECQLTECPMDNECSTSSVGTLDEEDIIQISLQESSLSVDDLNLSNEMSEDSCCSTEGQEPEDVVNVLHLWTHVSQHQQQKIELGVVTPQGMEKFHGIQPTMSSGQQSPGMYNPLKSKVNIASLGVRQIQKHIASSGFSKTVDIQVEALKKAKECNPQGRWWIKADACDVRKDLTESMRGIWAGDEDMGDGSLQALYAEYIRRCSFVKKVGTSGRSGLIERDVERLQTEMEEDLEFLTSGAEAANGLYSKAVEGSQSSDRTMMELAWTVVGFEELIKKVRTFQVQLSVFRQMDNDSAFTDLTSLKSNMLSYLKDLFTKKRTAASHILVFMIADELRNRKPYAILVKFMPYKSLTDS
ncbi:hypothetical protein AWC38_SpisGene4212 [Stylophora pistillata]|uniref:Uncharacterized protein n=1 Tax=Stylophora pistillata TaxID=50429 RepID=A0A2B4SR63_STYPI|nr:hypothetical protein AWC38_SpisGene4212 [Stylophora pistillata]